MHAMYIQIFRLAKANPPQELSYPFFATKILEIQLQFTISREKKHTLALDTECISLTTTIILHFSAAINSLVQIHRGQNSKN